MSLATLATLALPYPMDFSAWIEVYLGGRWFAFDPRHNRRRIGRIVMARGRDASDVALTAVFGEHSLAEFLVVTEQVSQDCLPVSLQKSSSLAKSLQRNLLKPELMVN
jgi:transglutaminase-like putative cysteine protease